MYVNSSERRRRKTRGKTKPKKKRTKFGYRLQPELPVEVVEHALASDALDCKLCNGKLESTGKFVDAGEEITIVEREYKIVHQQRRVYRCQCPGNRLSRPNLSS